MKRPPPRPPHPDLLRRPDGPFGWLEARLLHEGWLERLGPDATAVLTLLSLAADRRGASFYSRTRMGQRLRLSASRVDDALTRLQQLGLVAHRPWRVGQRDGVWQLLPLPGPTAARPRDEGPLPVSAILAQLGLGGDGEPKAP